MVALHSSSSSGLARSGLAKFLLEENEAWLEAKQGSTNEESRTTLIMAGRTKNVSPFPLPGKVTQHLCARYRSPASFIRSEAGI
jgi:hypothetical protein